MSDRKKVLVITAPSDDRRALYEAVIKPLFEEELGWDCIHLDDSAGAGNKIRDLVTNITESNLVIVDLTEIKGDVFYELGISHVLSNRVLTLVCKGLDTAPSHLKTFRLIQYEDSAAGGTRLAKGIADAVRTLPSWSSKPSNPVREVLPAQWLAREAEQDGAALAQTFLNEQQKLQEAFTQKVDQLQVQMLLKFEEMARATGNQPDVIDISLLNKQHAELRTQLEEMIFKRNQAEGYLARLARDRDAVLQQMRTVARTLEADGTLRTSPRDGAAQIFVPATLIVPGPPRATEDERRQAERFVKAFYMDVFPVTNAQFERFVAATGYTTIAELDNQSHGRDDPTWRTPQGAGSSIADRENHPVVWVYRADALAFAAWAGRRLPTRLEWERAMRGVDGQAWPWGDGWDAARCNLGSSGTTPVDAFPEGASPAGCLDMVGNVWEWLSDELPGRKFALMGGSWAEQPEKFKVGFKQLVVPGDGADAAIGFRCAMDVPEV